MASLIDNPDEPLTSRLLRKLSECRGGSGLHKREWDWVLDPDVRLDEERGELVGGVSFRVRTAEEFVTVHHEELIGIKDAEALDDWLAQTLSLFLMKHPQWP